MEVRVAVTVVTRRTKGPRGQGAGGKEEGGMHAGVKRRMLMPAQLLLRLLHSSTPGTPTAETALLWGLTRHAVGAAAAGLWG